MSLTARKYLPSIIAAACLAACGQSDQPGSQPDEAASETKTAAGDPCQLLGSDEVAAITTDGVTGFDRHGSSCRYHSALDQVTEVTFEPSGGAARMKVARQAAGLIGGMGASVEDIGSAGADVSDLLKPDASAAPKLGDEAMWGLNDTLSVRKGDVFVEVTPPILHDPATHGGMPLIPSKEKRRIAQAVAEKVLGRLP